MAFARAFRSEAIEALIATSFWRNVRDDRELFPEIRDQSITIYYKGRALIRDLRYVNGHWEARVHTKFVPVEQPLRLEKSSDYFVLASDRSGRLDFKNLPRAIPLGDAAPTSLSRYKSTMRSELQPEDELIHSILTASIQRADGRTSNCIVDQQIALSAQDGPDSRIDICYFDRNLKSLMFAEVKRCTDQRLYPRAGEDVPEVVYQLRRYREEIDRQQQEIRHAYCEVVRIKRQLGCDKYLQEIPNELSVSVNPVLVIGGMTGPEVRAFKTDWNQRGLAGKWRPLTEGLHECNFRVILAGGKGKNCLLNWEADAPSKLTPSLAT
jgi:hypothetical protein